MTPKRGLGRGILDLTAYTAASPQGAVQIPVARIRPNPNQPRRHFAREALEELAESIRRHGVIQPLLVTPDPSGNGYILVAGERRFRAAVMAGLEEVPCVVRQLSAPEIAVLAMVENLQREDLNPMEEARGYATLRDVYGLTQEEIARGVGKSRPRVANLLRLLQLPEEVQAMLERGELSTGQALPLVGLDDRNAILGLARKAADRGMTAREVEWAVQRWRAGKSAAELAAGREVSLPKAGEQEKQWQAQIRKAARGRGVLVRIERRGEEWRVVFEHVDRQALRWLAERLADSQPEGPGGVPAES